MTKSILFILGIFLLNSGFAQELECDPKQPNLLEKIAVPNPEFEHRAYISPDEFQKYSSRELAEKLVQRMHRECDEERGSTEGVPLDVDSDIMMFVPSGALSAIEKYGFQNQHVTRTTSGANSRDMRYTAEIEFPGMILGYSPKSKDILPKYAALNVKREENIGSGTPAWAYGDTVVVFKEAIKRRTSWTPTDSLAYPGLDFSKITSSLKYKDRPDNKFQCQMYCEAQIWGDIGFSDIEYVLIQPGAKIPEEFKRSGIPVYYTKPSTSSVRLEKGEVAYAGDKNLQGQTQVADLKKGENKVTNRVIDQKVIPTLKHKELLNLYKNNFDTEAKRVLLGQIALENTPATKKFLLDSLSSVDDQISRSQILLGLSRYGNDPQVRNLFKAYLESKIPEATPQGLYPTYSMMGGFGAEVDVLTAMAIIADTEGFKDDKELRETLEKVVKDNGNFKTWYDRLFLKTPLCPKIDPNDPRYQGYGGYYGGGYVGGGSAGAGSGASSETPAKSTSSRY